MTKQTPNQKVAPSNKTVEGEKQAVEHQHNWLSRSYHWLDNGWIRLFAFLLSAYHTGVFMWHPKQYADTIGGFDSHSAVAFIWAICSAMVFGFGFKPRNQIVQLLFYPYFSLVILIYFTIIKL